MTAQHDFSEAMLMLENFSADFAKDMESKIDHFAAMLGNFHIEAKSEKDQPKNEKEPQRCLMLRGEAQEKKMEEVGPKQHHHCKKSLQAIKREGFVALPQRLHGADGALNV